MRGGRSETVPEAWLPDYPPPPMRTELDTLFFSDFQLRDAASNFNGRSLADDTYGGTWFESVIGVMFTTEP